MKKEKICAILFAVVLLSVVFIPAGSSIKKLNISDVSSDDEDIKLYLCRVEHYLEIVAKNNTSDFFVKYAFPPDYFYQAPIYLQILNGTTSEIINYKIENDTDKSPNKFVNFSLTGMEKDEHRMIHFTVWVLLKNYSFNDLPESQSFPNASRLPDYTKKWLVETNSSQKNNIFIRLKSFRFKLFNNDLISYADKVSTFIKNHRYLLFLIQLKFGFFFSQDAVTTLFINGENVGRSHLACAFLRNQNIPSRVILVNNDQGFWTQMHYMVEYYVPDYGWVLLDTTAGETPYDTNRQIINRICYPEDENDTKTDYIFNFMTHEERWMWFSSPLVEPLYIDCDNGSKSQMFYENTVETCDLVADACFDWTTHMFNRYQTYLGRNLSGSNEIFFESAVSFQWKAIENLNNGDSLQYYYFIERACEEYDKITV